MISLEQIVETMNRVLKISLDPKGIPLDVKFKALGIDSLDFYNVLVEIESITGRHVPDEDIDKLNTVDDLLNYFS